MADQHPAEPARGGAREGASAPRGLRKGRPRRGDDLLELDLEAGASYGALCAFLGIDQGCPAATDTLPRNLAMQKPPKIAPQNHESVSSLLATGRVRSTVVACKAALLVYPGFEELHRTAIDRADEEWPLGWELREFLPEVFVVDSVLHHPCRAPSTRPKNCRSRRRRGSSSCPRPGGSCRSSRGRRSC